MNEEILMHENGLGLDLTVTILCINNLKEQFKVESSKIVALLLAKWCMQCDGHQVK